MEKLIKLINDKIDNLTCPTINETYIDYYNEYKKYNGNIPANFCYKYLVLLYTSILGIERFDEINKLFLDCKSFFDNFYYYLNEDNDLLDDFFKCISISNYYEEKNLIDDKDYNKNLKYLDKNKRRLKKLINDENGDKIINSLIKLSNMVPLKNGFYPVLLNFDSINYYEKIESINNKVSSKSIRTYFSGQLDECLEKLNNDNLIILKSYRCIMRERMEIEKKINDTIFNYKNLKNMLMNSRDKYIDNVMPYLSLVDDDEIKKELLLYLLHHNNKYNNTINKENEELKNNQLSPVEILFLKYNIDISNVWDINHNNYLDIMDLEKKLKFISESKLSFIQSSKYFFNFLNIELDNIIYLSYLYDEAIIDRNFIDKNIALFENNTILKNFKENINFFADKHLNEISKYDNEIFMIDNELLVNRYNLLVNNYQISLDNVFIFEFLKNDEIFDILDEFIELGFYEQIKNNPNYLTSDNKLMIKRLKVVKLIDLNPINSDNSFIGSIISGKDFLVNNLNLDDYIIDYTDGYINNCFKSRRHVVNSNLCECLNLESYRVNDLIYNIDGIILSKNRILRNLSTFENIDKNAIFDSIIFKSSNLSDENIKTIEKIVGVEKQAKKVL